MHLHTLLGVCPGNCRIPNYNIHFGKGSYSSNFGLNIGFNYLKKSGEYSDGGGKRGCSSQVPHDSRASVGGKGETPGTRLFYK